MSRQGFVRLTAAVLALGAAAACFSDPTKSLRGGLTRLSLSQQTVTLHTGDSVNIQALVLDDQGNQGTFSGESWASSDGTVASVRPDSTNLAPGSQYARSVVKGVTTAGGVTTVVLTMGGLQDTLRVTVLPAVFPGTAVVSGTAGADTIVAPPAANVVISAGDTLTLTATATVTFSATSSGVSFGPTPAYILSRTSSSIKVMARTPYQGPVTITNLTYAGNATTGAIAIASINTANVTIQRARFRGAVSVGSSGLGANTVITVAAPAGYAFTTGSSGSQVNLGGTNATVLSRTAAQIQAISTANFTGTVMVTKLVVGTATIDSLRTMAAATIVKSVFPGTMSNGTGRLLDTVLVLANGTGSFDTTTGAGSVVTINGQSAFTLRRTVDTIYAFAKLSGTAKVSVTKFIISGPLTVPSLTTSGTLAVSTTSGEAANSRTSADTVAFAGAADTIVVYRAFDCEDDGTSCPATSPDAGNNRYFYLNLATTNKLRAIIAWYGNGSGGNPYGVDHSNPDLDVLICAATASGCTYNSTDLTGFSGAGLNQPEVATTTAAQAAGGFYVRVFSYSTPGPITVKLSVLRM